MYPAEGPRLRLTYDSGGLDDTSEDALRANLRSVYVGAPVGMMGLSTTPIYVSSADVVLDTFSKVGSTTRVRGSYVASEATYLSDSTLENCHGHSLLCRKVCVYEGDNTLVTFDITFDWPD